MRYVTRLKHVDAWFFEKDRDRPNIFPSWMERAIVKGHVQVDMDGDFRIPQGDGGDHYCQPGDYLVFHGDGRYESWTQEHFEDEYEAI